jgi:hypothetical protein
VPKAITIYLGDFTFFLLVENEQWIDFFVIGDADLK